MRAFSLLFAATVFAVSMIVYASTLIGFNLVERFPQLMFLHVFVIAAFIAAVAAMSGTSRRKGEIEEWLKHNAPRWLKWLSMVVVGNAIACCALFFFVGRGDSAARRGDKFVAVSKGQVVRELTEAQYHTLRGFEARFFSSFWMLFSGVPALVAIAARRAARWDGVPANGTGDWNAPPRITELDGGKAALIEQAENESQEPLFKLFDNPGQSFSKSFTLDELPADLHSLLGTAGKVDLQFHHSEQIKILGPDGQWHTFHTAEEMPPELRQLYETNQQPNERTTKKVFLKLADSQGGERTYHSLDEMPAEVRALFEQLHSCRGDV